MMEDPRSVARGPRVFAVWLRVSLVPGTPRTCPSVASVAGISAVEPHAVSKHVFTPVVVVRALANAGPNGVPV